MVSENDSEINAAVEAGRPMIQVKPFHSFKI